MNKRKLDFVANVSHEFKNPLAIINVAIAMGIDGLFGKISIKQKKMLKVAKNNVERLIRLTTNLLDISARTASTIATGERKYSETVTTAINRKKISPLARLL